MRLWCATALMLVVAACGSPAEEPVEGADPDQAPGAASAELAVSSVIRGIAESDAALLDAMTVTDQLGLVALVEDATIPEAEAALGFASEQVASQFWESFSSGVEDFLGAEVDEIRIGEVQTIDVPGARYSTVEVAFPLDSANRSFVVTDRNGWKVDLVATFPGAFLPHMDDALQRASTPDASGDLAQSIRRQAVSLDALEAVGVPAELSEALASARQAVESGG